MSLRARLLIVIAVLIATYIVAAVVVASTQQSLLERQVDKRLVSLPLLTLNAPPRSPAAGSGASVSSTIVESPYSDVYVGFVSGDGSVTPMVTGGVGSGTPDLLAAVTKTGGSGLTTIKGVDSSQRFRALVTPDPRTGNWFVAAQSLNETDAAIDRLTRTLVIAGLIIALILGVAFFWIERLGLRPIARVTATAEAIAAGDRSQRVDVRERGTEAGKLGIAFNLMLDERDQSDARLRQFIADASHELRTPLTSIRGYLQLYRQGAFREQAQLDDVVRRLSAESARMQGLVEDLLALASLDEGRPLRDEPVDLGQLVRDAAQDAQAVQRDRSIVLETPESGPTVSGDPALLTQLVGILVSNALAHTPEDALLTLTASREPERAVMTVADTGPGLDAEAAAHVFDRFWRGQSGRTRGKSGGSGLGLSIARSIVDAHHGTISLKTAPGEGCVFTITVPLETGNDPAT